MPKFLTLVQSKKLSNKKYAIIKVIFMKSKMKIKYWKNSI